MGTFDRVLLCIYTFVITVLLLLFCAVSIAVFVGFEHLFRLNFDLNLVSYILANSTSIMWFIVALFIAVGLKLFLASISRTKDGQAIIQEHLLGQVHITPHTMEEMVKRAVYKVNGVRRATPKIIPRPEGIDILLRVTVVPDINIPNISERIQQDVKEYITELTGISVRNIKIIVESIAVSSGRV